VPACHSGSTAAPSSGTYATAGASAAPLLTGLDPVPSLLLQAIALPRCWWRPGRQGLRRPPAPDGKKQRPMGSAVASRDARLGSWGGSAIQRGSG
jgi:hypothetical protein